MKKRALSVLLAGAVVLAGLIMGCSATDDSVASPSVSQGGSAETETAGVLRVGMECAYAPFNWTQINPQVPNGDTAVPIYGSSEYAYGYDVMLAQMLADELGMQLEIHRVDWSSIILGLDSNNYDAIIGGMGYTEERDAAVDFTEPYYMRDNVMIMKEGAPYAGAVTLEDFTGAAITTQIGTIWESYVPQIPDVNQLTFFETTSEVVMAVSTGAADGGILDEPTAKAAIASNPDIVYVKLLESNGFVLPETMSRATQICIAVREGDSELQAKLNEALAAIEWNEEKMVELMDLAITL
jgi:putative lysine transport system substrate-binding protein